VRVLTNFNFQVGILKYTTGGYRPQEILLLLLLQVQIPTLLHSSRSAYVFLNILKLNIILLAALLLSIPLSLGASCFLPAPLASIAFSPLPSPSLLTLHFFVSLYSLLFFRLDVL